MSRAARWLIAYDIVAPRRLVRVHRALARRALPVQYSVFLLEADPAALREVLAAVGRLIDHRCDDVRAYPIPRSTGPMTLGLPFLPVGIVVGGMPRSS